MAMAGSPTEMAQCHGLAGAGMTTTRMHALAAALHAVTFALGVATTLTRLANRGRSY